MARMCHVGLGVAALCGLYSCLLSSQGSVVDRWVGELPAHAAVCERGESKSADDFKKVPEQFVAMFSADSRLGYFFFASVIADEKASSITWELCANADNGAMAPKGLEARKLESTPALFIVCGEETSTCAQDEVHQIADKIENIDLRNELAKSLGRGFAVDKPTDGKIDRAKYVREAVRADMDIVQAARMSASQADGDVVAALRDPERRRTPLSAKPPSEAQKEPIRSRLTVVALPVSAALATVLRPMVEK